MSKTIWKFVLDDGRDSIVSMPLGAQVLDVQTQGGFTCVWALVDSTAKRVFRRFKVYGTGHDIETPDALSYIGTFQVNDGGSPLVFHVFEVVAS